MKRLVLLVLILGAAFVLRIVRLDAVPLRGDEAFSVRYWADPPNIKDLAQRDPQFTLGIYPVFSAWKQSAGDTEFAMRYLPLLINLIGVAAMAALSRHLFHDNRVGILAAMLWAVNPFLIWHAQDVRNYAPWAALSLVAMWLFLRAVNLNHRRDWALYVLAETAAAYLFFLEGFFILVQAVYLLMFHRAAIRRALIAWAASGLLLIPWFIQLWWLAHSDYSGTVPEPSNPARLLTWFLPILLIGRELPSPWAWIGPLVWSAAVIVSLWLQMGLNRKFLFWLAAWILIPTALLMIVSTRISIFHPRYLIAITPALLLLMARAIFPPRAAMVHRALAAILLITPLLGFGTLWDYYQGKNPKSADWRALAAYLTDYAHPGDLILQVSPDPAFKYYYRGAVAEGSLTGGNIAKQLAPELDRFDTFWLIGSSPDTAAYLREHRQEIGTVRISNFTVAQFRSWQPDPAEIALPTDIRFGDIAHLRGVTIQGPDAASPTITVLLYWEPLAQADIDYQVFVHLIGVPHTHSPLWDQDDHRPVYGFASTLSWEPGTLIRDPYHLLDDNSISLAPGDYTIQIGMYDPIANTRLPVTTSDGESLGDSYPIAAVHWPPQ